MQDRLYGTDRYWIDRYERGSRDDETDEWLLGWQELSPLVSVGRGDGVVDLGCGNSPLCFDLLQDHPESSVLAIDIAPGAVQQLRQEQTRRVRRGEASAARATLACFDACVAEAWTAAPSLPPRGCSVLIDKSTTDGLLCDTKHGAARVRSIYAHAGRLLRASASVLVVSWRDPSDGLDWLVDIVLGGLRQSELPPAGEGGEGDESTRSHWSVDAHTVQRGGAAGPTAYVIRRRPRRVMRRRVSGRQTDDDKQGEDDLVVRQHVHEVETRYS